MIAPVCGAYGQTHTLDIPSEDLKRALSDFIQQTGVQLLYNSDDLAGLQSRAIHGTYDAEQALHLLLLGTRTEAKRSASGAFAVVKLQTKTIDGSAGWPFAGVMETVVVTGTSIRGAATIGSNVMVFTREDMESSGATTIQQFLSTIPTISGFGQGWQFGAGTISPSGENLPTIHNLGASSSASTLILMNGRPLVPSGSIGTSDPGIIPAIALERIDIMPDGDSAIYGSSAVAGVINFVTRSSFEGVQTDVQFGQAHKFQDAVISLLTGHRWPGGSVMAAWEYRSNSQLLAQDRGFSSTADLRSQGGANFATLNCSPATIAPSSSANDNLFAAPYAGTSIGTVATAVPACDTSGLQSVIPSSVQHSVFVDLKQNVGGRVQLDVNAGYNFRMSNANNPLVAFTGTAFGPVGTSGALGQLSRNPFYQGNAVTGDANEFVRWDPTPLLGPSHTKGGVQNLYLNFSASTGLRWGWAGELNYTTGFNESYVRSVDGFCAACANLALNGTTNAAGAANSYASTTAPTSSNNLGTIGGVTQSLDSLNALDVWTAPGGNRTPSAILAKLKSDASFQTYSISMNDVKVKFDGPLFTVPAGDVKAAWGAEFQQVNYEQVLSDSNAIGPTSTGGQFMDQVLHRTVRSGFLEFAIPIVSPAMNAPLIKSLDIQLAARYDDYSDAGTTRNPKLGFNWDVGSGLKARGSYSTSFTAPSVIFLQGVTTITPGDVGFTIPYSHPAWAGSFCTTLAGPCSVGPNSPYPGIVVGGPNPDLKPMTGQSYTAGLSISAGDIWSALSGWSVDVTWWRTKFVNVITLVSPVGAGFLTTPGLQQYLQVAPPGGWTQSSPEIAAAINNGLVMAPLPQRTYYISNQIRVNAFNLLGDGIDFNSQYAFSGGPWGEFKIGIAGSWKLDWDVKGGPNGYSAPYVSYLNGRFDTSVIKAEALEARINVDWGLENWRVDLFWSYTNPYWFQTSTGPFATSMMKPAGFPNAFYSGGFQRVRANSTFDLNLAYALDPTWLESWARTAQVSINVKNIANDRPPFVNIGGIGRPAVGYNGNDNFNADPLQRLVSIAFRQTW